MIKKRLDLIRKQKEYKINTVIWHLVLIIAFGGLLGFISKYTDSNTSNNQIYNTMIRSVSEITSSLGIWIFIAALIAIYSPSPLFSMLNTCGFFVSMLSSYYLYSKYVCGFYSIRVILAWSIFAILATIFAWFLWYGMGRSGLSIFLASLPISILLILGYTFYYAVSVTKILDMVLALVLLYLFSKNYGKGKFMKTLVSAVIFSFLIDRLELISILFGGL